LIDAFRDLTGGNIGTVVVFYENEDGGDFFGGENIFDLPPVEGDGEPAQPPAIIDDEPTTAEP